MQNGYSNNRYYEEILIAEVETIENFHCLKNKGVVLSLDMRKAFESLSHNYLKSVQKFYNFGTRISK